MLKYLILLFNLVFLLVAKILVNENVTITPSFPTEVKAGSEFVMELTINRTNVEGFAKFQQELPAGFTAKEMESKGASFTFSDQMVKLIWTSLPTETEFKINYKITVDKDDVGTHTFGGKFSYIIDNVKQIASMPESTIKITSPGEEKQPEPIDTKTVQTTSIDASVPAKTDMNGEPLTVFCSRKISPTGNAGEFLVEVTINKDGIGGFAKLQENIPLGYSVSPLTTNNASFTYTEQKAKFVWVTVPTEQSFSVSYNLKAENKARSEGRVNGLFSYIENDETKKFIIDATSFKAKPTETPPDTTVKQEPPKVTNIIPEPEKNVVYKVQIMALHKAVKVAYFKQKNKIVDKINTEMHEGFTKYTVGSFGEYKPARDHREEIRAKQIVGPFVTAYNSGKRITVQEALMITSQKWYK